MEDIAAAIVFVGMIASETYEHANLKDQAKPEGYWIIGLIEVILLVKVLL